MSGRKILFLATEDYFIKSHFAPLLERARTDGFEVVVAARSSGCALDARVVELPFSRGSLSLVDLSREVLALRKILAVEKPDVVHALSLKPVVTCLIAAWRTPQALAVTGLGYFAVNQRPLLRIIGSMVAIGIRGAVRGGRAVLVVENESDRRWVEGRRAISDDRVFLMPGAGVDPDVFKSTSQPEEPVVIGVVTRLVRSKGVDLLVSAVRRLRSLGFAVTLRIAGAVDPKNPESVSEDELAEWAATPGIVLLGAIRDVPRFWAATHIACLPSRGGEGLPRSLIEAASCARPLVTTDVPGCADFVRDGTTGFVAPKGDVEALTTRLLTLVRDAELRKRMGQKARELVVSAYSEKHAAGMASRAWARALQSKR